MRKFIPINQLFDKLKNKGLNTWLDKLTFFRIFFIWALIIVLFGIAYYFFASSNSYLLYSRQNYTVNKVIDSIYFSFITATSTGYGDILPAGFFKIIAIFEVTFGLLLLAFVTSKLISIKQDIILSEIYDISFNEKINRLRSSLLIFRQNISRIISKIEENTIRKREISDIYIYIHSLEDTLNETVSLTAISTKSRFKKVLDALNTELLFNSILSSFEKINELITILNQNNTDWKRDIILDLLNRCITINDSLFAKMNSSKHISEKTKLDLNSRKNTVIETIKKEITTAK